MQRQLDIFDDSRDVALRNDLAQALLDGNPDAAGHVADTLAALRQTAAAKFADIEIEP